MQVTRRDPMPKSRYMSLHHDMSERRARDPSSNGPEICVLLILDSGNTVLAGISLSV